MQGWPLLKKLLRKMRRLTRQDYSKGRHIARTVQTGISKFQQDAPPKGSFATLSNLVLSVKALHQLHERGVVSVLPQPLARANMPPIVKSIIAYLTLCGSEA
jgi:hypothetical protein